ncbi:hypothetical protein GTU79_21910 [Sodalis ligni]|uniref:hypothetical protein n=1 Tax=Sodalis ligni TaxID=2697027 RepID=UPI001BDEA612|nr:hypothetical protein [Sodalis ligni]QWA09928.1 hypothetical protein GTU79_21910 [Sodalis ligni]
MHAIKIKIESNYFLLTEINNFLLLDVALGYLPTIRCFLKAGQEMQSALDALNDTAADELRKKVNLLKRNSLLKHTLELSVFR